MDLLKLFALLVAVGTAWVSAEGPKKKIRIHLPQKVKHIHHHKKIYITNHPAASQYAPAFMPSAVGAMSVPTSVALPAMAGLMPVNSMDIYSQQRVPGLSSAGSKLLPLYHSRGYYGPNPTEWEDQEYDLSPPPEPTDISYVPAFSGSSEVTAPLTNYPQKKVKVIKSNEPRKKSTRKGKTKRVAVRKPLLDEEIPVSTFHEQFYSDLDGSATLRKVKKPQRVEKIIDGDNEHIHTYSEEHIHKLVYNDGTSKLIGGNPVGSMSAISAAHSMFPIKNSLVALSPEALTGFASMGSMGPSHLEYSAYNPHEVTHDHVFHDHGEIPSDADISKENLPYPPRVSYTSQGIRIGGHDFKGHKSKFPIQSYPQPTRPTTLNDYSYYENMYQPYTRARLPRPMNPTSHFLGTTESTIDDYNPIPSFKLRDKGNIKTRNTLSRLPGLYFGSGKQTPDYQTQQTSVPAPFSVSSTVVHDYKPKNYGSQSSASVDFNKLRDPLHNFKDNSYTNNLDFDSYSSASNLYAPENKQEFPSHIYHGKKGKKKSISTQNIRIGGLDHQTTVDHLGNSGLSMGGPNDLNFDQSKGLESATSTPYTIRESSLAHSYYTAMAEQALHGDQQIAEASNTDFQYIEAPPPSTTEFDLTLTTTGIPPLSEYIAQQSTDTIPTEITESTEYIIETRPKHRLKDAKQGSSNALKNTRLMYPVSDLKVKDYKSADRPSASTHTVHHGARHSYTDGTDSPGSLGSRKYGDKI